jgi:hypothetical protein
MATNSKLSSEPPKLGQDSKTLVSPKLSPKSPPWKVGQYRNTPLHELPPPELPPSVEWLKNGGVKDASRTGYRKI